MLSSIRMDWKQAVPAFFFSMYLTMVIVVKRFLFWCYESQLESGGMAEMFKYMLFILAFWLFSFCVLLVLGKNAKPVFERCVAKRKISKRLFFFVFAFVFGLYMILWGDVFPGGIYQVDCLNQWKQVQTMIFVDHHPAFHTLLIWLVTRIVNSYVFFIFVQITFFSLGLAFVATTLDAWGISRLVISALVYCISMSNWTQTIIYFAWKDVAMTCFFLFLLSNMINIFFSKGEWLKRRSHRVAYVIVLAAITLVRHNAILFTFPLLSLMLIIYKDKRKLVTKCVVGCVALVLIVKGPVYSLFKVQKSTNNYIETVGVPMTILTSVYGTDPSLLSEEARVFMASVAELNEFKKEFVFGDFNSVKWTFDFGEKLKQSGISPFDLLKMTWDTIKNNTLLSSLAVVNLTDFVWDPVNHQLGLYLIKEIPKAEGITNIELDSKIEEICGKIADWIHKRLQIPFFEKMVSQLGVLIIVMILGLFLSIKWYGWSGLWLIIPVLIYNFGTMLLLSSDDHRFFHFNLIACYPLMTVLLSKPYSKETGNFTGKSTEA